VISRASSRNSVGFACWGQGGLLGLWLSLAACGGVSSAETTAGALKGFASHPQVCSGWLLIDSDGRCFRQAVFAHSLTTRAGGGSSAC